MALYNLLVSKKFKSDKKADFFLSEILRHRDKLNNSVLRREKYNIIKEIKEKYDVNQLFSTKKGGKYYYNDGWNQKAFVAWAIAGVFSVLTVWHPALSGLGGYAWIIGAALGTVLHLMMSGKKSRR